MDYALLADEGRHRAVSPAVVGPPHTQRRMPSSPPPPPPPRQQPEMPGTAPAHPQGGSRESFHGGGSGEFGGAAVHRRGQQGQQGATSAPTTAGPVATGEGVQSTGMPGTAWSFFFQRVSGRTEGEERECYFS